MEGNVLWIVLAAVVFVVVLLLILFKFVRGLQSKRAAEVMAKFEGRKVYGVTSNANFFGQESKGRGQVRGNGVLVLAEGELYFEMWTPKRSLRIPFAFIQGVEQARSHLGKRRSGPPLLKVLFTNEKGQPDSAAWQLGKFEEWKSSIEKALHG
jgi:hypothetical protein